MIRSFIICILFFSHLCAQTLVTVPEHVWKFKVSQSVSTGDWVGDGRHYGILGQPFSLTDYGKRYFDHDYVVNDYFASPNDLYDLDTIYVDLLFTIGDIMRYYNSTFAPENNLDSLPDYSIDYFGTDSIDVGGTVDELKSLVETRTTFEIIYGVSNRTNWFISVPIITRTEDRTFTWHAGTIPGYTAWYQMQSEAKSGLETVLNDPTLQDSFLDLLQKVYDRLYTWNGNNSVLWAMEGGDDPVRNGIYGYPNNPYAVSDTSRLTLSQLENFYWVKNRMATGFGDISSGFNYRLLGDPVWSEVESGFELYTGMKFTIPLGSVLPIYSPGSGQFPNPPEQSKKLALGSGVSVWYFFLDGSWYSQKKGHELHVNWYIENGLSSKESIPTPFSFLGVPFMHHDSIMVAIGETYLYRKGFQIETDFVINYEFIPDFIHGWAGLEAYWKNRDDYWSKNKQWDSWMTRHNGYDSMQYRALLKGGISYRNSNPFKRILPILFELEIEGFAPIFIRNQYRLFGGQISITTYFQAW